MFFNECFKCFKEEVMLYYPRRTSTSRQKRKQREQKKQRNSIIVAVVAALAVVCLALAFVLSRPDSQPLIQKRTMKQAAAPFPSPSQELEPGYERLSPSCDPERAGIVRQLKEVLNTGQQASAEMPPYIQNKVQAMLDDIQSGSVCAYSEQKTSVIIARRIMEVLPGRHPKLYIYLHSLDDDDKTLPYNIALSLAHERLHLEINSPSTLENFYGEEIEVRKRICDNGVMPLMEGGTFVRIPAYLRSECRQYRDSPEEFERSIREAYTKDWYKFEKYTR